MDDRSRRNRHAGGRSGDWAASGRGSGEIAFRNALPGWSARSDCIFHRAAGAWGRDLAGHVVASPTGNADQPDDRIADRVAAAGSVRKISKTNNGWSFV